MSILSGIFSIFIFTSMLACCLSCKDSLILVIVKIVSFLLRFELFVIYFLFIYFFITFII